jgi:hypothetical protein
MGFGHEKLDVYRLSIGYVAWVYEKVGSLNGVHRPAGDQWLWASQSIPLSIPKKEDPNQTDSLDAHSSRH